MNYIENKEEMFARALAKIGSEMAILEQNLIAKLPDSLSAVDRDQIVNNVHALIEAQRMSLEVALAENLQQVASDEEVGSLKNSDEDKLKAIYKTYLQKTDELLNMARKIEYTILTEQDEKTSTWKKIAEVWKRTLNYYKRQDGRYFRVLWLKAESKSDEEKWTQCIIVQEKERYDKRSCEDVGGEIALPLRVSKGTVEVGITVISPPGSFGRALFTAPRASFSNPNKSFVLGIKDRVTWSRKQRQDANRMTGRSDTRVVWVADPSQIDSNQEKIVWFTLEELNFLKDHPNMEDAPTLSLINWVLANTVEINRQAAKMGGSKKDG